MSQGKETNEIITQAELLIAEGQTGEALKLLSSIKNRIYRRKFLQLSNRFQRLSNQQRDGVLSTSEYNIEAAKINKALITALHNYEQAHIVNTLGSRSRSSLILFAALGIGTATIVGFLVIKFTGPYYKTIEIAGKTWMAENLDIDVDYSWCYNNDENCKKYGRLYTWEAANTACKKLAGNWRLPTKEEWEALANLYGGVYTSGVKGSGKAAYKKLLVGGESGFDALLGGDRYPDGSFWALDYNGYYWSSSAWDEDNAWHFFFGSHDQKLGLGNGRRSFGSSCRCVHD